MIFIRNKSVTCQGAALSPTPAKCHAVLVVLSESPDHELLAFPILQLQRSLCRVSGLLLVCCGRVKEAESSYCNYLRFWAVSCASNPVTQNRRKPLCPKPSYLLSHTAFSGKGRLWQSGEGISHGPLRPESHNVQRALQAPSRAGPGTREPVPGDQNNTAVTRLFFSHPSSITY